MKRVTAALVAAFASLATASAETEERGDRAVLNVVNWSWYVELNDEADESLPVVERAPVLQQFMDEFECDVRYVEMDDESAIRDYVLAHPAEVDVVNLSTGIVADLAARGVLLPLDGELLPHKEDVRVEIRAAIGDDAWGYCAPYFLGYTGVLYRRDLLGVDLTTWSQFLRPEEGQVVGLLNAHDSTFGFCSLMLGDPMDTVDPDEIKAAGRELLSLKKSGRIGYLGDDLDAIAEQLSSGALTMAVMYSGDGLAYEDEDDSGNLAFGIPLEGTDFYVDTWAIPARSEKKELAHHFIDFMLRPEAQVRQAMYLNVQVVTEDGLDLLRESAGDHPHLRYLAPDDELRAKSFHIHRTNGEKLTELWERIMGAGD